MSNYGLNETLAAVDGKVVRTKVGDRYVIEAEMMRQRLNLGGEQSGHIIFRDFTTTGDGIITALQILRIMVRPASRQRAEEVPAKISAGATEFGREREASAGGTGFRDEGGERSREELYRQRPCAPALFWH